MSECRHDDLRKEGTPTAMGDTTYRMTCEKCYMTSTVLTLDLRAQRDAAEKTLRELGEAQRAIDIRYAQEFVGPFETIDREPIWPAEDALAARLRDLGKTEEETT